MGKYAINEELLQQIETLQTILSQNVAGQFGGVHQSKTFGSSCDFADFRDYIPGDDITKIDWNSYARFEKLYLKLYLDERKLHTRIYIDASRSMDFDKGIKSTKALQLAATIAYLSICEMDKVSIYYIQDSKAHELILNMNSKDAFFNNILKLNEIEFKGDFALSEALEQTTVGYGDGLSVIISDFETENDYVNGFNYLSSKKRDILSVQILNREEFKPHIRGKVHFYDSENINKFYRKNITKEIINAYNEALEYTINSIREVTETRGGHYMLAISDESLNDIFLNKLIEKGVLK